MGTNSSICGEFLKCRFGSWTDWIRISWGEAQRSTVINSMLPGGSEVCWKIRTSEVGQIAREHHLEGTQESEGY